MRTGPNPATRLFYFPLAGGGASTAQVWKDQIPSALELCAIQLPGRETRLKEAPISDWRDLLEELVSALAPELDRPFAFIGYSMGALIAFELARALRQIDSVQPDHLFVIARPAPQLPPMRARLAHLPDSQLIDTLSRAGMFPSAVTSDHSFLEMILPAWRMDLSLSEGYRYRSELPFEFPISAFGGISDLAVRRDSLLLWKTHTTARFEVRMLPGNHMLPPASQIAVMRFVLDELFPTSSRG